MKIIEIYKIEIIRAADAILQKYGSDYINNPYWDRLEIAIDNFYMAGGNEDLKKFPKTSLEDEE